MRFLDQIDTQFPADQELHLFIGIERTLGRLLVNTWLEKNPHPTVNLKIDSAGWLDKVDRLFRTLSKRPLPQGMIQSIAQLQTAIAAYLAAPKAVPKPFSWTAKLTDIHAEVALDKLHN